MSFATAHPALAAALATKGYTEATPVQASVLTPEVSGRDLLVSARTGSGKTVAFGMCMAETLLGEASSFGRPTTPLALVVAPTRELALQVKQELAWLFAGTGARVVSCVGGMDVRREAYQLNDGAHIVVGTPGRLCDHLDRGVLKLDGVKAVVLDEADEMLDLGFRDELEHLLDATPEQRRTLLFSATLPPPILSMASRYQRDALRVAATAPGEQHADIEYRAVVVSPREREHVIVNLLRYMDPPTSIVFCATRDGVSHLTASLLERGFTAVGLSGELSQNERTRALQSLRDGRARVLVATDVAARGLDLPSLQLVIHADLPHDGQVLLHRSGRTGRAGRKGTSVLVVPFTRVRMAERLLREARLTPRWSDPPMADQIRAKDQERVAAELANVIAEPTEDEAAAAKALAEQHTPEAIAAALLRLAKQGWPEPEELPETDAIQARMSGGPRRVHPGDDRSMGRPAAPQRPVRGADRPDFRRPRRDDGDEEADNESSGSDAGWGAVARAAMREDRGAMARSEPARAEPRPESPRAEAPRSEARVETARTEPARTEPARTEPARTEPAKSEAPADPEAAARAAAKAAAKAQRRAEWEAKNAAELARRESGEGAGTPEAPAPAEAPARAVAPAPSPIESRAPVRADAPSPDEGGRRRAYLRAGDADPTVRRRVGESPSGPAARGELRGGESPVRRREAPGWDAPPNAPRTREGAWGDDGERPRPGGSREVRGVWFRMNVGRNDQADPRWLIPLICRRGGVEKADIGAIRIHDDETRFEVAGHVASRFAAAVKRPDRKDPWVRFQVLSRG